MHHARESSLIVHRDAESFPGTDRFLIARRLGAGAYGVVFEAYDRQEKVPVALKVLRFAEADALYRFKNGVRLLADIRHPNLTTFYGLESVDGWWFLIMELIQGSEFIEAMRGEPNDRAVDGAKLRDALGQLARGLQALHRHGRLHRDIKPSNVMVTPEGRVALLDFGLVTELERVAITWSPVRTAKSPIRTAKSLREGKSPLREGKSPVSMNLVGTPAYMAPEQAEGGAISPASDWYSVGVMLYEALTGEPPFSGNLVEVFSRKARESPPDPRREHPGLPDDLVEICLDLLCPKASERLTAEQVLQRLGLSSDAESVSIHGGQPESTFVGRREALDLLNEALSDSRSGAVSVYVRGPSGVGKTALVRHFLARLKSEGSRVVVLTGRCFLGESVPYKALDSLVDALARFLTQLPETEAEALLPIHVAELARLFPVLRRVDVVAGRPRSVLDLSDPQAVRRRAFMALRELLARLAERRSLILVIDDLQWGDLDSFQLLEEVFRPPDTPPLLLIGCYRSEDQITSPFLGAMSEHLHDISGTDIRQIDLEDLTPGEAHELVSTLQGSSSRGVEEIVNEGGGSPLFLTELVRYSADLRSASLQVSLSLSQEESGAAGHFDLRDVLRTRIAQLTAAERRLLEVVALTGRPLDLAVASQAAGISSGFGAVVDRLHAVRLLRRVIAENRNEVETYHDRIREAVVESLSPAKAEEHHRSLASAHEATGTADPETLVVHFRATQQVARARRYALRAAKQAEEALAFERAARLFQLALDLTPHGSPDLYRLRMKLGHALAHAGRGHEAAESLLAAVENSGTLDPLEAQRDAAEQLLISGHIDRGLAILRHVLRTVGMELQTSRWKVSLELRWLRWRLALRLLVLHPLFLRGRTPWRDAQIESHEETVSPSPSPSPSLLLRRIDVCWSVEIGLCLVDVLHASHFHARHLLLALRAGEPRRIARGMAMEVFFGAMDGNNPRPALELARRLGARLGDPSIARLAEMATGMRAAAEGRWHEADRRLTHAEERLREEEFGVVWELDTVRHLRILARLHLGRWAELFEELPRGLEHARQRGDHYLEIHLRHWVECLRHLADDNPRRAAETAVEAIDGWSHQGFHFQHFGHLVAMTSVALYEDDGATALDRVEAVWPELRQSMIQRINMVRGQSLDLRARAAIAAAKAESSPRRRSRLLSRARRDARRLEFVGSAWTGALSAQIRAGADSLIGSAKAEAKVQAWLEKAEALFLEADMPLHAAVSRRRLAQYRGEESRASEADGLLEQQGVQCPDRLANLVAPGIWTR